jgi:hypothetical protein
MNIESTSGPPLAKSWRPRFSLRLIFIGVTIACLYFGCWFPTATKGVRDIESEYRMRSAPKAPLVLACDVYETLTRQQGPAIFPVLRRTRTYYFWFFGWTAKLNSTQSFSGPPGTKA